MRILRPLLLFAATIGTTCWALGWAGGLTLMAILVSHEMGHYLTARRHGVPASLPHFIPMPPFFLLGTLGAVISMRTDRATRNQLMDIGAAGPIAGFLVAVPAMIAGVMLSKVAPISGPTAYLGDSMLSYVITELLAPARPPGTDLMAHSVLMGAWGGFLVTAINLIPLGQLDGGHVLYAFSPRASEVWMRRIYKLLIVLGVVGLLVHVPFMLPESVEVPPALLTVLRPFRPYITYALLIWALFGRFTGLRHPPVVDETEPLTPRRRYTAYACLAIMLLTFMPSPIWMDRGESPVTTTSSPSPDGGDRAPPGDAPESAPLAPPAER